MQGLSKPNLIIYGNTNTGKSTLMRRLYPRYEPMPATELSRQLRHWHCNSLPTVIMNIIDNLDPHYSYCFDHFYIHTHKQLYKYGTPMIIWLIDVRQIKVYNEHTGSRLDEKLKRFDYQAPELESYIKKHPYVKVYNTDFGFDVSELIRRHLLPSTYKAVI